MNVSADMLEKMPHDMNRAELLAYVNMLEQKVEFLNATVRKAEADAVVTVAALVRLQGGEAIIPIEIIAEMSKYQIARVTRQEDQTTVFTVRKKPEIGTSLVETDGPSSA